MENNNKLKINTIAGILDIIAAVFALLTPILALSAMDHDFYDMSASNTKALTGLLFIYGMAVLAIHIVALIKSNKVNISKVGNILGIIYASLYIISPVLLFLPILVLSILSSVCTLKQKIVKN